MRLCGLRLKKKLFFTYPYLIFAPPCSAFLKHVDFYKAHRSEKRVCSDWPAIQCVVISEYLKRVTKCYAPFHIWNISFHGSGSNNTTTARIKVTPSFFVYTFRRRYANIPTQ